MPDLILIAAAVFMLAGAIKGLVGVGLPTAALAFLTLIVEPRLAISLVLFPIIGSNFWQIYRGGHILRTARRYGLFAGVLAVTVALTVYLSRDVDDRILLAALGSVMLLYVGLSLAGRIPALPERYDRAAQISFGVITGGVAGLASAWAGPMAIYLSARQVEKEEFVRATGFLIFAGGVPLLAGYVALGFTNGALMGWSFAMLIPTLLGFWLGERWRRALSGPAFSRAVLIVFALLALNLLRRAIWPV